MANQKAGMQNTMTDRPSLFGWKPTLLSVITTTVIILGSWIVLGVSALDAAKVILFWLFWIVLPGYTIVTGLTPDRPAAETLALTLTGGIAVLIAAYFIGFCLDAPWLFRFYPLIPVAVFSYLAFARRLPDKKGDGSLPSGFFVVLGFALVAACVGTGLSNQLPTGSAPQTYGQDMLWHIGNAQSLFRSFPPIDARVSGELFSYHYFDAILDGAVTFITGVEAARVVFHFAWLLKITVLVSASYYAGLFFLKENKKAVFFVFVLLFASCASMTYTARNGYGLFLNIFYWHVFLGPFGFELALPFLLVGAVAFCRAGAGEKTTTNTVIATAAVILATGSKGPVGAVFAGAALVAATIVALRDRVAVARLLILSGCLFAGFAVVYLSLLSGGAGTLSIDPTWTVSGTALGGLIASAIPSGFPRFAAMVLLIPLYLFLYLPFAMPLFAYSVRKALARPGQLSLQELFLHGVAVCGLALGLCVKHSGSSQLYFLMVATPFIGLIATERYMRLASPITKLIARFFLVVAFISGISSFYYSARRAADVTLGTLGLRNAEAAVTDSFTGAERAAALWLKENAPRGATVASNRVHYASDESRILARYFYVSAFSGLQLYLEGYAYSSIAESVATDRIAFLRRLFAGSASPSEARERGISYIWRGRRYPDLASTDGSLPGGFVEVFVNEDVDIYKVE